LEVKQVAARKQAVRYVPICLDDIENLQSVIEGISNRFSGKRNRRKTLGSMRYFISQGPDFAELVVEFGIVPLNKFDNTIDALEAARLSNKFIRHCTEVF